MFTAINIGDVYYSSFLQFALDLPDGSSRKVRVLPPVNVTVLIIFRSEFPTEFDVKFYGRLTNGELMPGENRSHVKLDGGIHGSTLNVDLVIDPRHEGLIWFEIYIDEELATKMPFQIIRREDPQQGESQDSNSPEQGHQ